MSVESSLPWYDDLVARSAEFTAGLEQALARNVELAARLEQALALIADLEARLKLSSSNSSKPPLGRPGQASAEVVAGTARAGARDGRKVRTASPWNGWRTRTW